MQNASYLEANQRLLEEVRFRKDQIRTFRQQSTVFETQILQEENARRTSNIRASCDYQPENISRSNTAKFETLSRERKTSVLREINGNVFDSMSQRQSRCSTTSFVLPSRNYQSVRYPSAAGRG